MFCCFVLLFCFVFCLEMMNEDDWWSEKKEQSLSTVTSLEEVERRR